MATPAGKAGQSRPWTERSEINFCDELAQEQGKRLGPARGKRPPGVKIYSLYRALFIVELCFLY
ncbi:hypothetical protein AM499_15140 [Bacillus sp. FJAT-22090]|nr:hypothetical protein AM499_15140 [Bacillus sp. FJAT-22090]